MQIRFKNIPVPEAYILALFLGVMLHNFFPMQIFRLSWPGHLIGWPLVLLGTLLSLWATSEAGEANIESPTELITSGPYAHSRNPMYLGWALLYAGFCLIHNSLWTLGLLPIAFAYIHFFEIPKEEHKLEEKFSDRYNQYRRQVPRYL